MSPVPTAEQQHIVDEHVAGKTIAVRALAGTGKTSTLRMMAAATPTEFGQYLAFNKAIVKEVKGTTPRSLNVCTVHALAMQAFGGPYRHRLDMPRMRSNELARLLRVDPIYIRYGVQTKVLQPGKLASLAQRAVRAFCLSDDAEPAEHHVPYLDGIDVPDARGNRTWENNNAVRAELMPAVRRAWEDLGRPDGQIAYNQDHAYYFKRWVETEPQIPVSYIVVDEAQDLSRVMLQLLVGQNAARVSYVGDPYQQLYDYLGAVNSLDRVSTEATGTLTQSWRFGDAVAERANLVLGLLEADVRVVGNPSVRSRIGELVLPEAIMCRTNATAVRYVLEFVRDGIPCHLVGGNKQLVAFANAVQQLRETGSTYYHDLACFTSWQEVVDYVEADPAGSDLKLMVDLVEEFGVEAILTALDHTVEVDDAAITVSTAHKVKGMQWGSVQLAEDFAFFDTDPDLRVLYVAATRPRFVLDPYRAALFSHDVAIQAVPT